MVKKLANSQSGSTVIEVLIATTVVAFALTGLAVLMTSNVKNSAEADYREAAAGIAQDAMERIRQRKTTVAWATFLGAPYTDTGCSTTIKKYNTDFWVDCSPSSGSGDSITITTEVCWPESIGPTCTGSTFSTKIIQRFYNN